MKSAEINKWFIEGKKISNLDWLNIVKPLIIRHIAKYVLQQGGTIDKLKKLVKDKQSCKAQAILSCITYLEEVKKKYLADDKVARMILINYGLLRRSK